MIGHADNQPQAVQVRKVGAPMQRVGESGESIENLRLTRKQAAVLRVIMDPTHADKTNREKAKIAGVSEPTFYAALQHEGVEAERRKMVKQLVTQAVTPAIQALAKTAAVPGRDGFQDRRLLLSMSGDYVERQQHDVNVSGTIVGVVGVAMEEL